MARRPHFGDEPMSRLAVWSARLAWFALAVAAMSVIILRSGLLEIVPALATFGAALVFAVLAILLAFASFVVIWRQGLAGLGRALLGMMVGIVLLAYPAYLGYRGLKLPRIDDITTDTTNPPRFDVLARLRPRGTTDYPGQRYAIQQRTAYPEIVPLQLDMPVKPVYDIVQGIITKRKWLVVDARTPTATRRDAVIESVARTPIMGFRDDVVVRITPVGTGARVDVRSASRYGTSDFGANARRIRALLDDIDDAVGSAPEPRAEPEKPESKPAPKRPTDRRQPANR
jgi:uncharacterized protein (DUF1499 family)